MLVFLSNKFSISCSLELILASISDMEASVASWDVCKVYVFLSGIYIAIGCGDIIVGSWLGEG